MSTPNEATCWPDASDRDPPADRECPRCGGLGPENDGIPNKCVCLHTCFGELVFERTELPATIVIPRSVPAERRCPRCAGLAPLADGTPDKCCCRHDRYGRLELQYVSEAAARSVEETDCVSQTVMAAYAEEPRPARVLTPSGPSRPLPPALYRRGAAL